MELLPGPWSELANSLTLTLKQEHFNFGSLHTGQAHVLVIVHHRDYIYKNLEG